MQGLGWSKSRGAFGLVGAALWACNGIVGIEELHSGPDPHAGGAAGDAGAGAKGGVAGNGAGGGGKGGGRGGEAAVTGGKSGAEGGANGGLGTGGELVAGAGGENEGGAAGAVGAGGATSTGGASSTGGKASSGGNTSRGGAGGAPTGGRAGGGSSGGGNAGAGNAGAGNAGAGGGSMGPGTVSGTVIDVWGHPIPSVAITIGTSVTATDSLGKFSIASVAATYDATLVVTPGIGGGSGSYAYVYQGLTRRDPTLQVYRGVRDQSASPIITPTGANASNKNVFAFGSPDGASHRTFETTPIEPLDGIAWFGPATTKGAYHVLSWRKDANGAPTTYHSYLTAPLSPVANTEIPLTIALTDNLAAASTVAGSVTSPTSESRANYLFARFKDNAVIPIASVAPSADAFTFNVPVLSDADMTVAASEGTDEFYGPYGIAYKSVAPGATGVALNIPSPPTVIAPADGRTGVNGSTVFQWAGTDHVVVLHVEAKRFFQGMFIITSAKSTKLPEIGGSFFLPANEIHTWQVEVHGDYKSVDQVARPGGFLSTFGAWRTEPQAYRAQDEGFFAASSTLGLATAP